MTGSPRDSQKDKEALEIAELVRATQKGDSRSFGVLIRLTQRRLFNFAFLMTGQSETAEDLCQETYLKAFEAIQSVTEPQGTVAWLYRILKNLATDRFRSHSYKNEIASEEIDQMVDERASDSIRERILEAREVLQCLEPEDRFLILAVHLEGYSYREAADAVELTEDAVRLRLHKARKRMTEILAQRETNSLTPPLGKRGTSRGED